MADKKIYAGSGKKKNDTWLKVSLDLGKLNANSFEFNGKRYAKVDINVKPAPDNYGKDVSVSIDTWQPEGKQQQPAPVKKQNGYPDVDEESSDLPF